VGHLFDFWEMRNPEQTDRGLLFRYKGRGKGSSNWVFPSNEKNTD
jgi:hypothetical protein